MKIKLLTASALLAMLLSGCGATVTSSSTPSVEPTPSSSSVVPSSSQAPSSSRDSSPSSAPSSSSSQTPASSSQQEPSSSASSSSSSSSQVQQYTLTFDSRGGSAVGAITKDQGQTVDKPTDPTRDGYLFTGWSYDKDGSQAVSWPVTLSSDVTIYANWNQKINIKEYLASVVASSKQSPASYIPEAMRADYEDNYVIESAVTYNYSNFVNVGNIKYGGHGEQWGMVLENIRESQNFFNVLFIGEGLITASVAAFNTWLDNNPSDTASHTLKETEYTAKLSYSAGILKYSIQYKTNLNIPFFGEVTPQIDMKYDIASKEKTVRIQLTENNAMKYSIGENSYKFAINYGVTAVSRKALFEISNNDGEIEGHIYEMVQYKDKELIPSCADFYINEDYVSVVGNKASGLLTFANYISELYKADEGKLLGYEVREEKEVSSKMVTFNTLWFNLNNITGINNIKYVDSEAAGGDSSLIGFYVNNATKPFATKNVGGISLKTLSRRFDIEGRKQYFYGLDGEDNLIRYETSIPMMFIQEEVLADFSSDVASKNSGLAVAINLSSTYLEKIEEDYDSLVDVFIENKEAFDSDTITDYIGSAEVIE